MFAGVVVVEAVIILMLLWVLLAGQPAAQSLQLATIESQSTKIAVLTEALPSPTPRTTQSGCPAYFRC